MAAVRLYVDEDAAQLALVEGLRRLGIDVVTVFESQLDELSDAAQLDYAIANQRTLYTLNVGDFARLHTEHLAKGLHHPGIIAIPRQRYSVGEKITRLFDFVSATTAEAMVDRMEYL